MATQVDSGIKETPDIPILLRTLLHTTTAAHQLLQLLQQAIFYSTINLKMQFTLSFVAAVAALSQVVSATPLAARADGAIKIIAPSSIASW